MSRGQVYFILALIFAIGVAIFAVQNPESISVDLFLWRFESISMVLVILASAAIGAIIVLLLGVGWQIRKFIYIRHLEAEVRGLAEKTAELAAGTRAEEKAGPAVENTNKKPDPDSPPGA